MKALIFICNRYEAFNIRKSHRREAVFKSSFKQRKEKLKNCIGVFISIEKEDNSNGKKLLLKDICKLLQECKLKTVLIAPFAHLSCHLARPEKAIKFICDIEEDLKKNGYNVKRSSFGYHKNLLLSVSGCNNNIRWRSYSCGTNL